MTRLVLRGQDSEILRLITRLRLKGDDELRGLIPVGDCKDLELYAEISEVPILKDHEWQGWKHHMDYLIAEDPLPEILSELPRLSPDQAAKQFLDTKSDIPDAPLPVVEENREEAPSVSETRIRFDFPGFAHELRREIRRSRRYHLGFCFTLFRLVNDNGEVLPAEKYLREPLLSLPSRVGRKTDF